MKKLSYSLLIALFSISAIFAQPMMNKDGNYGGMHQLVKNKLNLTEKQSKKFDDIIFAQRKAAIDTRAEIQKLRLDLQKMMNDNNVDKSKLFSLTGKISDLKAKMGKSRIATWYKIYNILDKDQRAVWTKVFNKFMQHGKKGMMRKGMMMNKKSNCKNMPQQNMQRQNMRQQRMMMK